MKIKLLLSVYLCLLTLTGSLKAQTDFDTFWTTFKSAVIKGDKATVASLTKFPSSLGYDPATDDEAFLKTKARFLKFYRHIFNNEVDTNKCFNKTTPRKDKNTYRTCLQ